MQVVKQRRDAALNALVHGVPYIRFLGIEFDRRGDELTAVLNYSDDLIGNPFLPAIHGGVTAAFLEVTAIITLAWTNLFPLIESGEIDVDEIASGKLPRLPRTIDFTVVGAALCLGSCRGLAGPPRQAFRPGHRPFPDAAADRGQWRLTRRPRSPTGGF